MTAEVPLVVVMAVVRNACELRWSTHRGDGGWGRVGGILQGGPSHVPLLCLVTDIVVVLYVCVVMCVCVCVLCVCASV
jgi:hypothetical protein